MKMYIAAVTIALGSTGMIVNACMFHDSATRQAPVQIAHLL